MWEQVLHIDVGENISLQLVVWYSAELRSGSTYIAFRDREGVGRVINWTGRGFVSREGWRDEKILRPLKLV